MLEIGTDKQFFIDDQLLDRSENAHLCMNPPMQHLEPVFTPRHEWGALGLTGPRSRRYSLSSKS